MIEAVRGLANARERMEVLAKETPGKYFVFSTLSHAVLAMTDTTQVPSRSNSRAQRSCNRRTCGRRLQRHTERSRGVVTAPRQRLTSPLCYRLSLFASGDSSDCCKTSTYIRDVAVYQDRLASPGTHYRTRVAQNCLDFRWQDAATKLQRLGRVIHLRDTRSGIMANTTSFA